jgi:hypothetical protein
MGEEMKIPEPTEQHQWLQQLVGDWTMGGKGMMPDGNSVESTGTEHVHSLGGLWFLCEGKAEMPNGIKGQMRMNLGYDPAKQKFIGNWFGSMMNVMWVYEGEVDESGKVLTLNTEGPGMEEGTIGYYRDVIEIKSPDHRTLTSYTKTPDGTWVQFMQADYRRAE